MIKFYARVDSKTNQAITLYYVDYSDYSEKRFDNKTQSWVPTDRIYYAVISGDLDYDELTEEDAQRLFPEAFTEGEISG